MLIELPEITQAPYVLLKTDLYLSVGFVEAGASQRHCQPASRNISCRVFHSFMIFYLCVEYMCGYFIVAIRVFDLVFVLLVIHKFAGTALR